MKEKKLNKNITRLVIISILIVLLTTSANSTFVSIKKPDDGNSDPPMAPLADYYEWIDDFDNEQKIDMTRSWGYVVDGGQAEIKDTFPVWTNTNWNKLVPVTVTNNAGQALVNYAIKFTVNHDSDMQPDYDDVRFKHENYPGDFLDYWIESYDSSQAVIWVKVPNLKTGTNNMYLFYGNPSATDESDYGSVFTNWEEAYPNDEQISYHGDYEGAWDPDVEYGNGYFLVAWEEGPAYYPPITWGFQQEIRCSMYSPDGGDPVVFDKRIYKDGTTYYRNENPSIAYNGNGKFFVAWERYATTANPDFTTMDIYARTVQKSGNDITVGSVAYVCTATNCQADANVQYDSVNNRFLVVWEDARDGSPDYDIYGRLYDSNGNPVSSEVLLCNDENSQCDPWVAFNSETEQYFIVWEEGITPGNGPFRIRGGRFDENLNMISTFTIAEPAGYPNPDVDYNFPCVEYDIESERYLVTWQDDDISDGDWNGNIYGKIYGNSGNVEVSQFVISYGNFERTDIVPYLSNAFFVAYDQSAVQIFGRLVSSEGGLIGGSVQLSTGPAAAADWPNIATDSSKIFVSWEDTRNVYPINGYPDAYGNILGLNIPDGSDITISYGQEKEMVLEAQITSKKIQPTNLDHWYKFLVEFDSTITFDILDGNSYVVLISNADNGEDLTIINPITHPILCLQAHLTRTNPSYTPTINWWKVQYEGIDEVPPVTTVDHIDGTLGPNTQYIIDECATVWLKAIDYPEDTGSGVNHTYFTIDNGPIETYIVDSGIHICSTAPNFYGDWKVNFWSVDYKGNIEIKTKPENYRTIYIDARHPEVWIYDPTEEAQVYVPFWVRADATDNAGIERVDFDIYPFSQNPGLPWSDFTPPYAWNCTVMRSRNKDNSPQPAAVSVLVRATAYDVSGQYWIHEISVTIMNWNSRGRVFVFNLKTLLDKLNFGIVTDKILKISMANIEDADAVKFVATKVLTGKQTTLWDNDVSNGISASFNVPTGIYKITATTYKNGQALETKLITWALFINR